MTVLSDGRTVATGLPADASQDVLVEMIGREVERLLPRRAAARGDVVLAVRGVTLAPHGDVDVEGLSRALTRIGYDGPLSIEWEDPGRDREWGARDALAFVRRTDFLPAHAAFDAAFSG